MFSLYWLFGACLFQVTTVYTVNQEYYRYDVDPPIITYTPEIDPETKMPHTKININLERILNSYYTPLYQKMGLENTPSAVQNVKPVMEEYHIASTNGVNRLEPEPMLIKSVENQFHRSKNQQTEPQLEKFKVTYKTETDYINEAPALTKTKDNHFYSSRKSDRFKNTLKSDSLEDLLAKINGNQLYRPAFKKFDLIDKKTTKDDSSFNFDENSDTYLKTVIPDVSKSRSGRHQEQNEKLDSFIISEKKLKQNIQNFQQAIKTIKAMLNEETIQAVTKLVSLPSTENHFIKNVIKVLKYTMNGVVECVTTARTRLMSIPKKWLHPEFNECSINEFKESWDIAENVHHIFQNAIFYINNFIVKLESCLQQDEKLINWCVSDIFNDIPTYVQETVEKLNNELEYGVHYLIEVPKKIEKCNMTSDAVGKMLLPFMIIKEMVKCVLSKAEL